MSDKSFGDHVNRNIVKNPLLSTAVTGLSIEDLTHNAVLVPVTPNQGLIGRSDVQTGPHTQTLKHSDHEITNLPSGDTNSFTIPPQPTISMYPSPLDTQTRPHDSKNLENLTTTVSKAFDNTDDDFDVNEYFARLQGTRYVSAPLNSIPDTSANLAVEENLEEINLNEEKTVETQQSITADIAQNFSQLPTVIPHVASAVFSSFSNMLNLKSKEHTPEPREAQDLYQNNKNQDNQELQLDEGHTVDAPLSNVAKEVAPPPKEMPVGGTTSYRITTKKKYAQIPGLSSGEPQKITFNPQTQNIPAFFTPQEDKNLENTNITQDITQNTVAEETFNIFHPVETEFNNQCNASDNTDNAGENRPNMFVIPKDNASNFFEETSSVTTSINVPQNQVIPPPPMFSSPKIDQGHSQSVKSVLPPSVARRIRSNHPVIKPHVVTSNITDNIFVPTFDPPPDMQSVPQTGQHNVFSPDTNQQTFVKPMFETQPPITSMSSNISIGFLPQTFEPTISTSANITLKPPPMFVSTPTLSPEAPKVFVPKVFDNAEPESVQSALSSFVSTSKTSSIYPISHGTSHASVAVSLPPAPPMFAPTANTEVEQSKPLIEPPKASGNLNFRMAKKRPQYYSGPIEGVGSISNNIKPVLPPVDSGIFQGALFSPEQSQTVQTLPDEMPFDLSRPETSNLSIDVNPSTHVPPPTGFDMSSQTTYQQSSNIVQKYDCNTVFDLSRATTEKYNENEPKETTGFGIIGSLKSKLSSLDINKLQSSVTNFFDPAFNDTIKEKSSVNENTPNITSQPSQSSFEIVVPTVQYNAQSYDYNNSHNYQDHYYQNQYNFYQNQDPSFSSYYSSPTYAVQSHTEPTMYTNTYQGQCTDAKDVTCGDVVKNTDNVKKETENVPIIEPSTKVEDSMSIENIPSDYYDRRINPSYIPGSLTLLPSDLKINKQLPIGYKNNNEEVRTYTLFPQNTDASILTEIIEPAILDPLAHQTSITEEDNYIRKHKQEGDPILKLLKEEELPALNIIAQTFLDITSEKFESSLDSKTVNEPVKPPTLDTVTSLSFFDNSPNQKDYNPVFDDLLTTSHTEPITKPSKKEIENESQASLFDDLVNSDDNIEKNVTNIIRTSSVSSTRSGHSSLDENSTPYFEENPEIEETAGNDNRCCSTDSCERCGLFNYNNIPPAERIPEPKPDVTTKMIQNITSALQLTNPVAAPFFQTVDSKPAEFDVAQYQEISNMTEETIENIHAQAADQLLDSNENPIYGWTQKAYDDHDYSFKIDSNAIGFYGSNSLFLNNAPTNASDDLKTEYKHHEDILPRQMSIPTAPPEEDDQKTDESGILDVNSIEMDAKKDFPYDEEFVIEPAETDDDKIEIDKPGKRDTDSRKNSEINLNETTQQDQNQSALLELPNQPVSMASYFDTGNYAAETHYKNKTSPSLISIPPGFEEEFKKRLALAKSKEEEKLSQALKSKPVKQFSDFAQTTNYMNVMPVGFNVETNVANIVEDKPEKLPAFSSVFGRKTITEDTITKPALEIFDTAQQIKDDLEIKSDVKTVEEKAESTTDTASNFNQNTDAGPQQIVQNEENNSLFSAFTKPIHDKKETTTGLPDPKNFFSDAPEAPESLNRLASYFASPPKTEHAKSFFELSESQNHYRHASENEKLVSLMNDLTSVQNIVVSTDQTIKQVNYFTVDYDANVTEFNKGDLNEKSDLDVDKTDFMEVNRIVSSCWYCTNVKFDTKSKVRTAMNDNSEGGSTSTNMNICETNRDSISVNFDGYTINEESNQEEGVAITAESRSTIEYTQVKHHWFYRVDVEDKSIWRGFSTVDSCALEHAYMSPDLNENTLVPTDGGRYDVNIMGRLRIPVYWSDKPTNVRRCSWFYKGTTDARYVPYTEPVAEKLEEEYHHGVSTGEWHRRLVLPNGEVVVMHGPSVMVHFLHSDAFSSPPQSTSRPRVVRRGHDESEIEDPEPSSIDHLLLLCHGVGSACDMRFRSVEEVVEDFRSTSLQLIQSHYRNSYDEGVVSRVEVLPISWHATLHSGETGVDKRLAQITLDSIPRLRSFTNDTVLDVLFYTSPVFCQTIVDTVCKELNRIYTIFKQRNPNFVGGVSLGGHSLGSVILYDLLCHQPRQEEVGSNKHYVSGPAGTGQPSVRYPCLTFSPDALYALGSPIAIFECIRGVESLGLDFSLPTCKNFFNIFHPYDPIAYRIEPLINSKLRDLKPFLIPHHKGRKRMHLELKDTMVRVGADIKQKLVDSLRSTWNKWKSSPTDGQLEKVVEEEIEREPLSKRDDDKEELAKERELSTPANLGRLNGGRRVDYVLQEAPLEMINEYLFAMSSHVGYWESEDTMLLMLREIYNALGVQPDSSVPQPNMSVPRTRRQDSQSPSILVKNSDVPSTSHET